MRQEDSDKIFEVLQEYEAMKLSPGLKLLKKVSNLRELPDKIYVIIKNNWS